MAKKWKFGALALPLILMTACGGEEQVAGNTPNASVESGSPSRNVEGPGPGPETVPDPETAFGRSSQGLQSFGKPSDRDGDGLPDRLDPDPDQPPRIVDPTSGYPFDLAGAHTEIDGFPIGGTAFSGETLYLTGEGFDRSGRLWVIFQTPEGPEATKPLRIDSRTWSVMPPEGALEVHLIAGVERSNALNLDFLTGSDPVVYPITSEVQTGRALKIKGRNLAGVDDAWFGSEAVPVISATADEVRVAVPEAPVGQDMHLTDSGSEARQGSNRQELDLVHPVTVIIGDNVDLPAGSFLRTYLDAQPSDLHAGQSLDLTVPGHAPVALRFDLHRADGSVRYNAFSAIAWPGQSEVRVTSESTVLGGLLRLRQSLINGDQTTWAGQRAAMEEILRLEAAGEYASAHRQAIADDTAFDWVTHRQAVITTAKEALAASTMSAGNFTASAETQYLHKQFVSVVSHRAIDGRNEFSNFTVVQYSGEVLSIITCNPLSAPTDIWPSDLCVENDNKVLSSVAAYIPRTFPLRDSYQPVAGDRVRRHVSGSQDSAVLGGNWGDILNFSTETFLIGDDGDPLCRMHTCYVEILTGAMGWSAEVPLSAEERQVVGWLRQRTVFETMVVPIFDELVGLTEVGEDCTRDFLLGYDGYAKVITEFTTAFRAAEGAAAKLDAFNSTVGKFAVDAVVGALGSQEIHSCLANIKPISEVVDGAKQRLGSVAKKANLYYKVAQLLDAGALVGEFVITPEKMVFEVKPRSRTWLVGPSLIDMEELYDESGNPEKLYIVGDSIYEKGVFNATVVFRDRYGDTVRMPMNDTHIPAPEDVLIASVDSTQRELQIPLDELAPVIGHLGAGPLQVDLELNHISFDDFPNQVLPVPAAATIQFAPSARLEKLIPFSATPGQEVVATGARLTNYDLEPQVSLRDRNNNNTIFPAEFAPIIHDDWELVFTVPDVPPGNYDVILKSGTDLSALTSAEPLLITRNDVPLATLVDNGANKDDKLEMRLLTSSQEVVRGASTGTPAILSIPVRIEGELVLQDGEPIYGDSFWWDNSQLEDDVAYIQIKCLESGPDEVCTFGLEVERAGITTVTGTETLTSFSGKLKEGQSERFTLVAP